MTKKLYYEDGYLAKFTAQVLSCEQSEKGYIIVLDQTAFYPEGGGQPADCGMLGGAKISYVYDKADVIYHIADRSLEVGSIVEGSIDFDRRFDLMQQHSGEHILSGLVHAKYGYNNVGFHLSSDYTTCDFDGELTREACLALEVAANEAIYKNLPISGVIYDDSDLEGRTYRSKLDLKGKIRLVTVPEYDTCACCGIHVKTTGEIGLIKVVNVERHRGGTRVTMLCGKRALYDYQQKQEVITKAGKLLSAQPETIITNLEKLQEEVGLGKLMISQLTSQLLSYKAEELLQTEEKAIFVYDEALTGDALRKLCILLTEKTDKIILVLTGSKENYKYALGAKEKDIRNLNKELTTAFNGKGGGKSGLCQGNLAGEANEIEAFFRKHIKE